MSTSRTILEEIPRRDAGRGFFHRTLQNVRTFFRMIRDPRYHFPRRLIFLSIITFIYMLSPIDLIPDFIPILGFADDVALVTGVFMMFVREVTNYQRQREI